MVNVTKENFIEESNDLIRHLPHAAFVAIDEEMTGISVTTGRPKRDQRPCEKFPDLKEAAETYSIIQWGVALFTLVETEHLAAISAQRSDEVATTEAAVGGPPSRGYEGVANAATTQVVQDGCLYVVRRYNFYTFPAAPVGFNHEKKGRDIVMDPASVAFLKQHDMSFDKWTGSGVTYTTAEAAGAILDAFMAKQTAPANRNQDKTRPPLELRRADDISFFARVMAGLREWLDTAIVTVVLVSDDGEVQDSEEGKQYLLPPCNAFLRKALYQHIELEYPSLILENAGHQQIRVMRLSPEEQLAREKRLRKEAWESLIRDQLGVWRVYEAVRRTCNGESLNMDSVLFATEHEKVNWEGGKDLSTIPSSARRVPLVVHNGFMDLAFLMSHFHGEIPVDYNDMKVLLRSQFPIIYDTKMLSMESPFGLGRQAEVMSSTLQNVYEALVTRKRENGDSFQELLRICPKDATSEESQHEAAYDAYLTGAIFAAILHKASLYESTTNWIDVVNDPSNVRARSLLKRNVLHQMSIFNTDLESADPYMDPMKSGFTIDTTFRVHGIDKNTGTRDIVRNLQGMHDQQGNVVNYEIIWVDDATFMVAACCKGADPFQDLEPVLRAHGEIVFTRLKAIFRRQKVQPLPSYYAEQRSGGGSWMSGFLTALGFGKKRSFDGLESPQNSKKQARRS